MKVNLAALPLFDFSRREFLKGTAGTATAFVLGACVPFSSQVSGQESSSALVIYDPNVFLRVGVDNSITLISKHLEMGQGITTCLATLVAEELDADWSMMRIEFAPCRADLYNNILFGPIMGTGGTTSTAGCWEQMRKVGAAARLMFLTAAAARWSVPPAEITVVNGVVIHSSGRRASFGELVTDAMNVPVPKDVPLKPAQEWQLIGKHVPRLDSPSKTTGSALFAMDLRRPGMLTAVVRRAEQFGAKVISFDDSETRKIDGVVDVIQISNGVAVLATDTWPAIRGSALLKVTWDASQAEQRSTSGILEEYAKLADQPGLIAQGRGDAVAAMSRATTILNEEFTFPYLAHAPMEPLNGTIEVRHDGAEIWSGSQLQTIDQFAAAQILGFKPEQIKINTMLGGGSFGRRGNPLADWTIELAEIGKAMKDRAPVHLVWTREDDIRGGHYRPLVLHRVKVGLTRDGNLAGWQHEVVSQPIFTGTPFEGSKVRNGLDTSMIQGIVDTPYAITDLAIEAHNAKSPLPVIWWRSVGHSHTGYVMETMMDEVAHATATDPVKLRLDLLAKQPRDAAVVRLAAEKAGWNRRLASGQVHGFAYHRSFNTRVAMVAEVTADLPSIKVERVVAAVDCGTAVNPDIVTAQLEGAIGFALSSVIRNQITLKNGFVEQRNFDDYEPTRMREMPRVEVYIVPSHQYPTGIGEPGVPPLAPAIGNAIFAATGKRLRTLPFGLKTPA
jgi:isoquinoline 1-oxidoreductase beta subunit